MEKYKLFKLRAYSLILNPNKGFTLIEMLISLSIGILVYATISSFLLFSLKTYRHHIQRIENLENIQSAINIIEQDIRSCTEVAAISNSDKLVLLDDQDVISYELKDNKIKRIKNNSSQYLTNGKAVDKLSFSYPWERLVEMNVFPYHGREPITIRVWIRDNSCRGNS